MGVIQEIKDFGPSSIIVDKEGDLRAPIAYVLMGGIAAAVVVAGAAYAGIAFNEGPFRFPNENEPSSSPLNESLAKADQQLGRLLSKDDLMAYGIAAKRDTDGFSFTLQNTRQQGQCEGTYTMNRAQNSITGLGHIICHYSIRK